MSGHSGPFGCYDTKVMRNIGRNPIITILEQRKPDRALDQSLFQPKTTNIMSLPPPPYQRVGGHIVFWTDPSGVSLKLLVRSVT